MNKIKVKQTGGIVVMIALSLTGAGCGGHSDAGDKTPAQIEQSAKTSAAAQAVMYQQKMGGQGGAAGQTR